MEVNILKNPNDIGITRVILSGNTYALNTALVLIKMNSCDMYCCGSAWTTVFLKLRCDSMSSMWGGAGG